MERDWSAFTVTSISLLSLKIFLTINPQEGELAEGITDTVATFSRRLTSLSNRLSATHGCIIYICSRPW
jgi:hypothetical protein